MHPPRLSESGRRILWVAIAVGLLARVVVAFKTRGINYDIDSFYAVRAALETQPFELYSTVNFDPFLRWPYMSGYLPTIVITDWFAQVTGTPFHGWVHVPQIIADGVIALLVQYFLGLRGASDRTRVAAALLVALGPSFAFVSGFHGQIDSLAILPAVAALVVWERSPPGLRRALVAGVLIGTAVSIKTSPGLVLLALLPLAGTWRERGALCLGTLAVPLLALAPWLVADGHSTIESLSEHRALPGVGGISLIVQPELARVWLEGARVDASSLSQTLIDNQLPLTVVLIAPFAALVWFRKPPAAVSATLLWVGFFVVGPGFTVQYVVWGLPFALMAGYVWQVAAVQAALVVPTALLYWHPDIGSHTNVYVAMMVAIWIALVFALARMTAGIVRRRSPAPAPAA